MSYAGDLSPRAAWDLLSKESGAALVDVRCQPEWSFVGVPDLSGLGKRLLTLSWQTYPTMAANPDFVAQVSKAAPDRDAPLLFLCRSGVRSRAAAEAMTAAGYRRCYNIKEGFEGAPDGKRHRGQTGGWKVAGLPWVQE